jgi:uncharacterized protein
MGREYNPRPMSTETTLHARLLADVKAAMKSGAQQDLEVLRMLLSDARYSAAAASLPDDAIGDELMLKVLRKAVKTRSESIAMYTQGGRKDLVDREAAQIEVVKRYLPAEVGEADIERVVAQVLAELGATTKADMGRVIKEAKARLGGGADGGAISRAVGARLK